MLNKYAVAVASADLETGPWIEVVSATSISDAEDRLIMKFTEDFDLSNAVSWNDFMVVAEAEAGLLFGEIIDVECL